MNNVLRGVVAAVEAEGERLRAEFHLTRSTTSPGTSTTRSTG